MVSLDLMPSLAGAEMEGTSLLTFTAVGAKSSADVIDLGARDGRDKIDDCL